ncbi:MAG: hypothetical protein V4637_06005 [Pseudomonadota bacterium]
MTLRTLALLLACATASSASAQKSAVEVTDVQIAAYKATAQKSCVEGGKKQGDPDDRVQAFCGCMITVLNKNLTQADWQQVVALSRDNRAEEELKVLAPSLKQLDTCRPQAPAASAPAPSSAPSAPAAGGGLSSGSRSGTGLTAPAKSSQGLR